MHEKILGTGKKALFLDRDGIINEDTGYPHLPQDIIFREGIFDFCRVVTENGFILVVVTNQAGIAKGYFTEDDVISLHKWMQTRFLEQGIEIAAFYFCPFHINAAIARYKKDSECRKPRPGMFLQAAEDLTIDLTQSFMIGDKESDRIDLPCLRSIILKSSYTTDSYDAETLEEAKRMIIQ